MTDTAEIILPQTVGEGFNLDQLMARIDGLSARLAACPPSLERDAVQRHIARAETALGTGHTELAWQLAKAAERLELHLVSDATVAARLDTLILETPERLRPEAASPIVAILAKARDEAGVLVPGFREIVVEALRVRDRHVDELFAMKRRVHNRLKVLSLILLGSLVALALALSLFEGLLPAFLGLERTASPASIGVVLLSVLLGGIGACLSAMLSFTCLQRAPDDFESLTVTAVRPLVGATSGMIALLVAGTGLVDLGGDGVTLGFLAFTLGFSERLVLGTVQRLEQRSGGGGAAPGP